MKALRIGALSGGLMVCGLLILYAFGVETNTVVLGLLGGVAAWLAGFIEDRFMAARPVR
ncbi:MULTISPECIES: hypothetical protein [unclassified Bradyrhizobium]|uniref:hypothetical protein n=1 Tax=unclassified Bradyrhizobium TaxID=2631580 RepID=UPI0028E761E9|nr:MULTISPECIES: hypothetical protein [unclassified Bradyrhizobium]